MKCLCCNQLILRNREICIHLIKRIVLKTLICISSNGVTVLISDVSKGSIYDAELVKQSDFLNKLEEGDLILADRGPTIKGLLIKKKKS